MEKRIKTTLLLLIGALLITVSSCSKNPQSALYQEIKSEPKLVLAEMAITKTAIVDTEEWYTVGKRIAVYSYNSYMQAYIDLSSLQMEDLIFDEDNKTVKVMLPPIVTEPIGRDETMELKYENIGKFRRDIDAKERDSIKEETNKNFNEEVENNPMFRKHLTQAAEAKARKYFETIFENRGYVASIDFKPSK